MSRQRVIRHNVRDDRFQHAGTDLVDYARSNGRNLGIGVGVVVAVLAGLYLFQTMGQSGEKAAAMQLALAQTDVNQNLVEPAAGKLTSLIQQHGGTASGNRARLLMGDVELKRGNAAAAETQFRSFLSKTSASDYMYANGQRGLAVALENESKFKDAAKAYEDILKAPVGNDEKAHALLDAARAYKLAGDDAAFRASLERVTKEFPLTRAYATAKIKLAENGTGAAPAK